MKAYTLYTTSHASMLHKFLIPSIPQDIQLTTIYYDKYFGGNHAEGDFWKIAKFKLEMIRHYVCKNLSTNILWIDSDILFCVNYLKPYLEPYYEYDVVASRDCEKMCSGFMMLKCTTKLVQMFDKAIRLTPTKNQTLHDQAALQALWHTINGFLLPKEQFWNIEFIHKKYKPLDNIVDFIPNNMVLFHANYISRLDDKQRALTLVQEYLNEPIR